MRARRRSFSRCNAARWTACWPTWSAVKMTWRRSWRTGEVVALVQFGRKTRLDELAGVPTARELVHDPAQRKFLAFAELPFFMALPVAGADRDPRERMAASADRPSWRWRSIRDFSTTPKNETMRSIPISGDAVRALVDCRSAGRCAAEIQGHHRHVLKRHVLKRRVSDRHSQRTRHHYFSVMMVGASPPMNTGLSVRVRRATQPSSSPQTYSR